MGRKKIEVNSGPFMSLSSCWYLWYCYLGYRIIRITLVPVFVRMVSSTSILCLVWSRQIYISLATNSPVSLNFFYDFASILFLSKCFSLNPNLCQRIMRRFIFKHVCMNGRFVTARGHGNAFRITKAVFQRNGKSRKGPMSPIGHTCRLKKQKSNPLPQV